MLALRLTAALAAVMVTATTASSTAQQAPDIPVSISAQLGSGSGPLLMEIDGHQNPPKSSRYAITGSLRAIPCPGKTYHFVIAATVGRARATYDAMMVLRRSGGDRIPCGTTLPRSLGRTFLRLQVYRKGSTPGNSAITVKGNRRNSAFKGTMSIGNLVCRDSHWLRVQLSGPSGPLSLVYEMNLKKVSIYGRPCS